MAPFARLLVIGFAGGRIPELKVNRLLLRHLDVVGVNWGGAQAFRDLDARNVIGKPVVTMR